MMILRLLFFVFLASLGDAVKVTIKPKDLAVDLKIIASYYNGSNYFDNAYIDLGNSATFQVNFTPYLDRGYIQVMGDFVSQNKAYTGPLYMSLDGNKFYVKPESPDGKLVHIEKGQPAEFDLQFISVKKWPYVVINYFRMEDVKNNITKLCNPETTFLKAENNKYTLTMPNAQDSYLVLIKAGPNPGVHKDTEPSTLYFTGQDDSNGINIEDQVRTGVLQYDCNSGFNKTVAWEARFIRTEILGVPQPREPFPEKTSWLFTEDFKSLTKTSPITRSVTKSEFLKILNDVEVSPTGTNGQVTANDKALFRGSGLALLKRGRKEQEGGDDQYPYVVEFQNKTGYFSYNGVKGSMLYTGEDKIALVDETGNIHVIENDRISLISTTV